MPITRPATYGLMAEFEDALSLVAAARRAYQEGYRRLDAFSPFPIEELAEAIGFHRNNLPMIVLIGGVLGCAGGYLLQYYVSVIAYPLNVGGKPLHSWPSFIPVTFETTVLVAALAAVLGMLALNGLPLPYHPVFNVKDFERATRDRFFLLIESLDPRFDREQTAAFLRSLNPVQVSDVDH
ncbi:MAG TPA: DUF3341 domain-containing protein [Acidobacteriota bacterium]